MPKLSIRFGWLVYLLMGLVVLASVPAFATPQNILDAPAWETPLPGQLISAGATFGADRPVIHYAPNGELMTVFNRYTISTSNGRPDPYYSISSDDGENWSNPQPIYVSPTIDSLFLNFAYTSNNTAHAIWVEDQSLWYSRRPTGGSWLVTPQIIWPAVSFTGVSNPKIISSGTNTLDIVWWEQDFTYLIKHARSTNGGQTWIYSDIPNISEFNRSLTPDVAVDQTGKLHVVWEEETLAGASEIYYTRGTQSGSSVSWTNPIKISGTVTISHIPKIIFVDGVLHVIFTESLSYDNQWIRYTECVTNCTTAGNWETPTQISGQTAGVNNPKSGYLVADIVAFGNCTYVYFHGTQPFTEPPFNEEELVFGVNGCDDWGLNRDLVTENGARSLYPILTFDNGWAHLVYEQIDVTNTQVYHLRGTVTAFNPNTYLPIIRKP